MMKTIIISVKDMQSDHCMNRVKNAVQRVVKISGIQAVPGTLTLQVESDEALPPLLEAIQNAGYHPELDATEEKHDNDVHLLEFKTNIHCGGCLEKVKTYLDDAEGIFHWELDTASPDKTLKVLSTGIKASEVAARVAKAGFNISEIKN